MDRKDRLVDIGYILLEVGDNIVEFMRDGITDRIGNIDRRRPGIDNRFDYFGKEFHPRPNRILAGELNIGRVLGRMLDCGNRSLLDLGRLHLQLALHVNIRGGDKGMNPAPLAGMLQRLPGPVDILEVGPAQTGDLRPLDRFGDLLDRFEIADRSDRETGLHDIDVHLFQLVGDAQFFFDIHAGAGRLLPVAQGRIENNNVLFVAHNSSIPS